MGGGNSSRGIVKEKIYDNPHKAKDNLKKSEIEYIEFGLRKIYKEMGWEKIGNVTKKHKTVFFFKYFLKLYNLKLIIKKILIKCLPKTIINILKEWKNSQK